MQGSLRQVFPEFTGRKAAGVRDDVGPPIRAALPGWGDGRGRLRRPLTATWQPSQNTSVGPQDCAHVATEAHGDIQDLRLQKMAGTVGGSRDQAHELEPGPESPRLPTRGNVSRAGVPLRRGEPLRLDLEAPKGRAVCAGGGHDTGPALLLLCGHLQLRAVTGAAKAAV